MIHWNSFRGGVLASLALALIGSAPAMAQLSDAVIFTGTASGSGTVSRTIIDVAEPNGPLTGPFGVLKTTSNTVNASITPGMTAAQIGTALRDAINGDATLASLGYKSLYTTPSGTAQQNRPKMTRVAGSFTVTNGNTVPGVTMAQSPFTVEDAPFVSPQGLALLAAALSGLAWRERRRRKNS